ncbi:LysR family transcriptional regulator [Pararhodospirillum oryzae]|uniref:LysR family transcriptional regulator n=1 Tax=Pararhodospirillum oryzae TaxID=478448 RepID=A0A512H7K8_9PROT|nr:LysR substrate-binding domain-containing protein [Pararhodospirillum oryzae]GEO81439.1 LysR family transcriptional regulator [Pararhodospirillum oryzae]
MDPRHLRAFLHIVETGSFSAAAERVNLTQPALSRQIHLLEDEAGEILLRRTGRGAEPTEAGLVLVEHARAILEAIDGARRAMGVRRSQVTGRVTVGLPPSVGVRLTAPLVRRFREHHPLVGLCLVEELSGVVQEGLLSGWIDVGLLYAQAASPALAQEALLTEDLALIGRPDQMPGGSDCVPVRALAELPILLPGRRHGLRALVDQAAFRHGIVVRVDIEADSLRVLGELAHAGLGLVVHAPSAFAPDLAAGTLVARPLGEPPLQRAIVLAWPRDRAPSRAALAMAETVRELLKTGGWPTPQP